MLAQKNDPGVRRNDAYSAGGLNAAHARQGDIEENDAGTKLRSSFDGFFAVSCFPNYVEAGVTRKNRSDTPAGNFMIVHYQDPNRRHVRSFRLLQLDKIFSRNQLPNQVQARVEYGKRYFCAIF